MATRGHLHHPLHASPHSFFAGPRHLLPRRFSFSSTQFSRRLSLTPALRSVQCMKLEDQAGAKVEVRDTPEAKLESNIGNTDVIDYVNEAAPGPMVEIDPVTVFRRIIAERCAGLATARAKQKASDTVAIQSIASSPFLVGSKWSGKSMMAVAVASGFLALAVVWYFLRPRTDREKQTELTSTKGKENLDESTDNGRRKLVKDTIKAPESVLTAMAIGAASVGRPKGHTGSSHDTPHVENGNMVDTQMPEGVAEAKPIVNSSETTALENMKTGGHRIPTFNQVPYVPSKMEGFGFFKSQSIGADVTEGPWFAQAADDARNSQLESSMQLTSVVEEVVFEDVLAQTQELHVSAETVVEKLVSEISVSDVRYETLPLSTVVDGEFLGEVVSVSVATEEAAEVNNKGAQVESFKLEEQPEDMLLADNSAIIEKLEQMIGQESIATMEEKNVVGTNDALEENVLIDTPTLELSNDGTNVADMDTDMSNTDSGSVADESDAHFEVKQSLTPLPAPVENVALPAPVEKVALPAPVEKVPLPAPVEKVALLEASASGAGEGQGTDSLDVEKLFNYGTNMIDMDTEMNNTDSDSDDGENDAQLEIKQSLTPLPAPVEKVALLGASASEADHEVQGTDSLHVEDHGDTIELLSGVDQTLEKIEAELDDVLDDVSLEKIEAGNVGETVSIKPNRLDGGVATQTIIEPLIATQITEDPQMDASVHLNQTAHQDLGAMAYDSSVNASLKSLEEDPREDNKKALEAALPALAIGVGTVGTLFGVAGGLQVVGFAALASFVSQDFFWAQNREELWQEVKGITDRQKLLDFLARRNIVRKEEEEEEEESRL